MPNTPNRSWPYPAKGEKPYFASFQSFANAIDSDVQSNVDDVSTNTGNISSLQTSLSGVQSFMPTGAQSFGGGGGPYSITTGMSGYSITSPTSGDVLELPAPSSGLSYFISCAGAGSDYVVLDASTNGGTIFGPFQTYSGGGATWNKMRIFGMPNWVFVYAAEILGSWNWVVWGGTAKIMNDDDTEEWMNLSFYPEEALLDQAYSISASMTGASRYNYKWYNVVFVDCSGGAIDVEISSNLIGIDGWTCTFVDSSGDAGANNITLSTEGDEKIIGQDEFVLSADYNSVTLVANGNNLFVK